jgi:hypothetical protein
LEAVYSILGPGFETIRNTGTPDRNILHITHKKNVDVNLAVIYDINTTGGMTISGTEGSVKISTKDSFYAFKAQLQTFVAFLQTGVTPYPFSETDELMRLLIAGIESYENEGMPISI